jgi:hypothetical protein
MNDYQTQLDLTHQRDVALAEDRQGTTHPQTAGRRARAAALAAVLGVVAGAVVAAPAATASVSPSDPAVPAAASVSVTSVQHDGLRATEHYFGDGFYLRNYGF